MQDWFTDEQIALRDMVEAFTRKEIEPIAAQIDRDEATPDSLIEKIADLGLFGLFIPEEYGGSDAGLTSCAIVLEEISKASAALGGMLAVQIVLCPETVRILGTEEQKQKLLTRSAAGENLMAYSQTEPAGTANVAHHLSKITPDGNGFRINGAKLFCTQGAARTYLVFCKSEDKDGTAGFGVAVVEHGDEGFRVEPYEDKLGWRGTNTGSISFDDVRLEADDILGELLTGAFSNRAANGANVIVHSICSVGAAQGLLDKTVEQVSQRELYGDAMRVLQPVSFWIAEAKCKILACRAFCYELARNFDNGTLEAVEANAAKAYVCDTMFDVTNKLLQLWGGSGIMNSTGVNRYMRDAKAQCMAEGASEMHYSIVGRTLLEDVGSLHPALAKKD